MNDIFPYTVTVYPDADTEPLGLERWWWLTQHLGPIGVDWDLSVTFNDENTVIYLFKQQYHSVEFALTWL